MLQGRKIIIGVTGSIAAYKAATLVRLLVKAGAEVRVVMTAGALQFITPLSLSVLSKNPVVTDMVKDEQSWNNHVELGLWGDMFLIAPASANTLAKMTHGLCDNMLLAVYLSARCPVAIAPAMDADMWQHPATQSNVNTLKQRGHSIIPVAHGELASGLVGNGRMAEPENIVTYLEHFFNTLPDTLKGKNILINAGPTQEPIDPVRYLSNHSTGKMGVALAEAAHRAGANVTLVTGPLSIGVPQGIDTVSVTTAAEMYDACTHIFPTCDIAILSAAVADYTPVHPAQNKIKKQADTFTLELEKTKDIFLALGKMKKKEQVLVGFALETENEIENAREKLKAKNGDMIVLNSLKDAGAGFAHDTNKVTLLFKDGTTIPLELKSKQSVANDILYHVAKHF